MSIDCLQKFLFDFYIFKSFFLTFISLLTAEIVKNSHILNGTEIIFQKRAGPSLKVLQYQN